MDFRPATAIKGQTVADFMFELTPSNLAQPWTVEVDGSSCSTGSGIGVKIHSPDGKNYEHSIRLHFPTSNNVAEYEAAIHGLKLLRTLGAEKVTLRTDSQLVARQTTGEFACKEPQITKYVETMVELTKQFAEFKIEQIPRTQNTPADALAWLASAWEGGQREILVDSVLQPSCQVLNVTSDPLEDWRQPILAFIQSGVLPDNRSEAKKLQHKAAKF